jgi:hypothetical protein
VASDLVKVYQFGRKKQEEKYGRCLLSVKAGDPGSADP